MLKLLDEHKTVGQPCTWETFSRIVKTATFSYLYPQQAKFFKGYKSSCPSVEMSGKCNFSLMYETSQLQIVQGG